MSHMLDVNEQDGRRGDPSDYLISSKSTMNHADIVKLLVDHGADVTTQDETLSTPLHLAACRGSTETVRLLIEHSADVTARDRSNRTPLHLALSKVSSSSALSLI